MGTWENKWLRNYRLTATLEDGSIETIEYPLTIEFEVMRNVCSTVNSMDIKIYNLSLETRNRLFQDRYHPSIYRNVCLQAGYDQNFDNLPIIFIGNIWYCYSWRSGTDIITNIYAKDGGWDAVNSFSSFSLSAGVKDSDILNRLIKDLSHCSINEIGDFATQKQRGVLINGNTFTLLQKYSHDSMFVDLEKVNLLNDNEVIEGEVLEINSQTGLLGTPRREDTFLSIDTLFEPRVKVCQIIQVDSSVTQQYNIQAKVTGISHAGTISEADCGELKTTFNLLMQDQITNKGFNLVKNNVITPVPIINGSSNFEFAYAFTKKWEGGYNANDPQHANYGIIQSTWNAYSASYGLAGTSTRAITPAIAKNILYKYYWSNQSFSKAPRGMSTVCFDTWMNGNHGQLGNWIKQAGGLNGNPDIVLNLRAANYSHGGVALKDLNGELNRINALRAYIKGN
jgi:hypothetical protein